MRHQLGLTHHGLFSTLNTAYDGIIQSMTNTAEDHVNVAEVLTSQVIDVLKALGRKNEETKKKVRCPDVRE